MKYMKRLFFIAAAAAFTTTAVCAAPVHVSGLTSQQDTSIARVRLVCDQDCRCWRTGYMARNYRWKVDDRARQDPNFCPDGGSYNGHYRTGPGTGLSFESRFPVRSFPFPF
jgi:hypothetical protein